MGQAVAHLKMPALVDDVGDVSMIVEFDLVVDENIEKAMVKSGEDESTKTRTIEELRELVYERGEISPIRMDDDFILRFLRARNFKVEPAYKLLANYCKFREDNLDYFVGMNLLALNHVGEANILNALPYKDQHGRRIIIFKIGNWNPNELDLEDIFKAAVGILEVGVLEPRSQIMGAVCIFDMEGLSMQHAFYFTPSVVSKTLQIISTSFPVKIASIHIINESWGFEQIFKLFKPFLSPRYEETVHFHGADMSSLHKHVEPKFLPKAYGGIRPEYNYIDWCIGLSKQEKVVQAMSELGYEMKIIEGLEEKLRNYT